MRPKVKKSAEIEWAWCMEYCKEKKIPPAQEWAWKEAKEAYLNRSQNERAIYKGVSHDRIKQTSHQ